MVAQDYGVPAGSALESSGPVGDAVKRLRTALNVTQSELAERAGISAGTMSMIENNRVSASADSIAELSVVLGCSPPYLRAGLENLVAARPWLRAYADAPSRSVEQVMADSSLAIDAAQRLAFKFVPDALPAFSGDVSDDEDIEAFALIVRAQAGLGDDQVVGNVVRSAERLGCVVLPMDSELGRHLGLSTRVDGTAVIRVARSGTGTLHQVPGDRQRFTVAHELGHLVLHHATRPPDSAAEAARVEKQAHRFAAAFIAPAEPLLLDLERVGGRVTLGALAQLKEIWGLAIKALVVRFQHLGLVDEDHARSLYKQISSRKWNKAEPVEVPREESVWFTKALHKRFSDSSSPLDAAAETLGLTRPFFDRWATWDIGRPPEGGRDVVQISGQKDSSIILTDRIAKVSRLPIR